MTVKRRLYISNTLMIVIPFLLCVVTGGIVMNVAMSVMGIQNDRYSENSDYNRAVSEIQQLSGKWALDGQPNTITGDVAAFGEQYSQSGITLEVYQNGGRLCASGELPDDFPSLTLLDMTESGRLIMDETMIYKTDAGEYTVLVIDAGFHIPESWVNDEKKFQAVVYLGIFMFSVVLLIIVATNRLLTRVVYNNIVTPLDAFVYGVHQLRDGNLEYRIEYAGKDEFAGVCADFNEMAGRLQDMVNARQKDDESRRELIAGISHDLRTPLTSIISYVEGLEKGIATTPAVQKRYFDTIKSKALDLSHIVSQLFLFSKLDVGEFPFRMEKLDIGEEIFSFVHSVSDEYGEKGLGIFLDTSIRDVFVSADPVQLRNALTNIFDNSLKYGQAENGEIRIACGTEGQNAVITLTDNGPGVPDDNLENLFTVFYRGDRARSNPGQGSGLGLAITAKILERLGGFIRAENATESGLRVIITLPVIGGDEP